MANVFKSEAIIEFSNGEKIKVEDGQLIFPVTKYEHEGDILTSKAKPFKLWHHIHDGLIPCITELLVNYEFFQLEDGGNKIYKSSAVVSITNL